METKQHHPIRKRRAKRGVAYGTAAALVLAPALLTPTVALADQVTTDSVSAAHGHGIHLDALGIDVLEAAYANSSFGDNPGLNRDNLNVSVLESLATLNLGTVELPLISNTPGGDGLLYLGDLGTLASSAESATTNTAYSASGILTDEGALDLDAYQDAQTDAARLNLTQLLTQVIGASAAESIIDKADLRIGALGAEAESLGATPANVTSQYRLAELGLDLSSPLVGNLVQGVDEIVDSALSPLTSALASGGEVHGLVNTLVTLLDSLSINIPVPLGQLSVGLDAKLNDLGIDVAPLTDSIRTELLRTPLVNEDETISVDLQTGTVQIDLAGIVVARDGAVDLNTLKANTEVLDADTVELIVDGLDDLLFGETEYSLVTKISNLIEQGLYDLEFNLDLAVSLQALGLSLADAPVTVTSTIGGLLGVEGHEDPVIDTSAITLVGFQLGNITSRITTELTSLLTSITGVLTPLITEDLVPALSDTITEAITPLVGGLLTTLDPLLKNLAQIRINDQPTVAPLSESGGDLGEGSFTVRALSVNLLPLVPYESNGNVNLQLGSATILSEDAADVAITQPTADQEFELVRGTSTQDVTVSGTGEPGAEVTVVIDGVTYGPVTVDADGTWSVEATGLEAGEYTATATQDAAGQTSTATVNFSVVQAPVEPVKINSPENGEIMQLADGATARQVTIHGEGEPGASVTVEVNGATYGPVTVRESDGYWQVSTENLPVGEYTVVATQTVGDATSTDEVSFEITAAAAPSVPVEITSPEDGEEITIADGETEASVVIRGTGQSGASITATLNGDTVGTGTSVNAEGRWGFLPVNLSAGSYTLVVTQDDNGTVTTDSVTFTVAEDTSTAAADPDSNSDSAADPDGSATADPDSDSDSDSAADPAGTADSDANVNASASASASANADDDSNASAQAAAQAAAMADASSTASAAADADATAAAQAAATADASTTASSDASSDANASAQAAAQSAASADADSASAADASATANANASAAAAAASNADSSSNASQDAAADAAADPDGDASADPVGASVAIISPADGEELALADGETTRDVTVTGIGEPGAQVTVTVGDRVLDPVTVGADGTWQVVVTGLEAGSHTIEAEQDHNGVLTQAVVNFAIVAESAAGASVAITSPTSGEEISVAPGETTRDITVEGIGEPGAVVNVTVGDRTFGPVTVAEDGTWSVVVDGLAVGDYTIVATQDDDGRVTTAAVQFLVVASTSTDAGSAAQGGGDGSQLPSTGSSIPAIGMGALALLLITGGAALFMTRSRRVGAHTEE